MRREKNNLPTTNAQNFENELQKNNEYILRAKFYLLNKDCKCVLRKQMTRYTPQEPTEYIKEPEINFLRGVREDLVRNGVDLNQRLSLFTEIHTYSKKEKREKVYFVPLKRNILFLKHVN